MSTLHLSSASSQSLAALVHLRARLLRALGRHPSWTAAETRVADYLRAHFAANVPELRQIDSSSPPVVLDQIVRYEAVHAFRGPRDLSRRLQADRRCYALFSPAMPNEPLVFTEVAFTRGISGDVSAILDSNGRVDDPASCDCAMFYSISSCQDGLRGVPFGNTLIRQVVDRLQEELPCIRTFATVSPVPGFGRWVSDLARRNGGELADLVAVLDGERWRDERDTSTRLEAELLPLCASYLLHAKRGTEPLDAVARFHLGNGARLERINWLGDRSDAGFERSAGITANYLYDLPHVETNSQAYRSTHAVIASRQVQLLAR
jgi:malonyl-CoA decarboxylase